MNAKSKTKRPTTPLAILRAARQLLSKRERWTQGAFGRTATGTPIRIGDDYRLGRGAVCWCAEGALIQASGLKANDSTYSNARDLLRTASRNGTVFDYNDAEHRTHRQILAWFGRAITLATKAASKTRRAA